MLGTFFSFYQNNKTKLAIGPVEFIHTERESGSLSAH